MTDELNLNIYELLKIKHNLRVDWGQTLRQPPSQGKSRGIVLSNYLIN